ncbi:hypothetical protein G8A07_14650 [Roseateles sp. DAIF2]|uniref:hypothetical protein n=1 Tax=Roseateles sp. DAIF2 TaxID=2714952 RepID=UPI0018A30F33|nr:hypothetical protein [Roseateles sp. DAIF2]QPF74032.1 hypothetical protein G8A07_14650 [Roseateles sp. DAIF2]
MKTQIGHFLNYTPTEIYLSFRTAPIGSLGVTGALYETSMLLGKQVALSYAAGYAVGTVIADLMRTYSPNLYETMGGTIAGMVDAFSTATSLAAQGQLQQSAAALFGLDSQTNYLMQSTGGDWDVVSEWRDWSGGGGCSRYYGTLCEEL